MSRMRRVTVATTVLCCLVPAGTGGAGTGAAVSSPAPTLKRADPGGAETLPPSAGPKTPAPEVSATEADRTLDAAEAALDGSSPVPDPTSALNEVAQILPALNGQQRRRGEGLLARPTDGQADPEEDGYTVRPVRAVASTHFCFFWVERGADAVPATDADANAIPDYVDVLAAIAEHVYSVEHGRLGWRLPPSDGARGCDPGDGRSRVDVYAKDLEDDGYIAADPGQTAFRQHTYVVVENDMAERTDSAREVVPALQAMMAHEYNHVVQFGYSAHQDPWMDESTATWMEEIVYPAVDDYLGYLGDFAGRVGVPLTEASDRHLKVYGSAVWNHFLDSRFGLTVIRKAWEAAPKTKPRGFAAGAYERAIRGASKGRSSFLEEFVRFAAATAEWRSTGVFPDSTEYPNVRRTGTLATREPRFDRYVLDHTTFRLAHVPDRSGRAVKLVIEGPRNVGLGLALVGRIGSGSNARVITVLRVLRNGGKGAVTLSRPRRFSRITAVLVNGEIDISGYARRDWRYTGDRKQIFAATMKLR